MSETGIAAIDTTIHKTNTWLKAIMDELGTTDRRRAYLALRAVLHALRDRLPAEEAVHLGAQLPMLVRGVYYENWTPSGTPTRERTQKAFLEHVHDAWQREGDLDPERAARAVFKTMEEHLARGEIEHVRRLLPAEVRGLFPS